MFPKLVFLGLVFPERSRRERWGCGFGFAQPAETLKGTVGLWLRLRSASGDLFAQPAETLQVKSLKA
ncbi:MAG: hypothetical protein EA367_04730 [Leptolyngbya sp. DLM2.Bin15]|nr:MAG: hypothetical protein EA367_04730 [Leptolyngbya sp. DLM2.Bin15]